MRGLCFFTLDQGNILRAHSILFFLTSFSSALSGLTTENVERSLKEHGPNLLDPPQGRPLWLSFVLCFFTGFGPLLWVACFFVFLSWKPFGAPPSNIYNLALAIALLIVIFLSGLFQFYQEVTTSMVLSGFANLIPPDCIVVRDGKPIKIPVTRLVIGDIVNLQTGIRVPADMRIISCSGLKIDKSLLTGESEPIKLTAEKVDSSVSMLEANNMAFMGCNVIEGDGVGIVIAVGEKNQLAKIAAQVTGVKEIKTSLQSDIDRFVIIIAAIAITATVVVIMVWVLYLRIQHRGFMSTSSMIANAISVLVAYVPEGLPLALSMGLTIIANRLCVVHFVLLKRLSTIETLGSMSMLASDKTGTLTQNKMTVTGLITSVETFIDDEILSVPREIKNAVLRLSVLCNQAQLETREGSPRVAVGSNGIDKALLQYAEKEQVVDLMKMTYRIKVVLPFSSVTKLTATVVYGPYEDTLSASSSHTKELCNFVLVKGSPEYILDHCTHFMETTGTISLLAEQQLVDIRTRVEAVCATGCRVIAVAQSPMLDNITYHSHYEFQTEPRPNFPLDGLIFLSCIAVSDPPREGVKDAVVQLRLAGIKIAMVTGDAASTAEAIARQVGIIGDHSKVDTMARYRENNDADVEEGVSGSESNVAVVVQGKDLDNISSGGWDFVFTHEELVFARTTPEQKLLIVKESQRRGFRVGVTGDGVNDSPALKRADVGIAMQDGSDVSRDAAAIVLLKNDFRAIVYGVREGRLIFSNLRKVIGYQISAGSWSEAIPVLATFFLGMPQPLSSFLMIIICCVTDVAAGVALTNELPEKAAMTEPPRDVKNTPLVDFKLIGYSYLFYGNLQCIGAFFNYFHYMSNRGPTNVISGAIPADDDGNTTFPIAYKPNQLIGAWNWGLDSNNLGEDEAKASNVASSVFFVALVVGQMGHLLSIRRKMPYFSDAIMDVDSEGGSVLRRIWNELRKARPLPAIILAWIVAVVVANIFNEIPSIQVACGTGSVPPVYWGLAFGWSALWFLLAEIRKWIILLYPNSIIGKTAW